MPASFSVKPGRNVPCPCGSGKKYKRCCLPKIAESEETLWARERAASDDLSRAILRYAERKFGMCILDAWDDFHLGQPDGLDHPDFDEGQIFFPYFLFHWTPTRSEEHTSELQSRLHLVCRLLLEKKKTYNKNLTTPKTA